MAPPPVTLLPSVHEDTFTRDNLPPTEAWPELLFDLPQLTYPDRLNAAAELLARGQRSAGPEAPCLRAPGGEAWSYAEVVDRSDRIARVLVESCGIRPGNRVLLRGPNSPWLCAAWLGVLKAGGVAVATMALLRARELTTIGEIAEPALALCDHRFLDELATGLPGLPVVAFGGTDDSDLIPRTEAASPGFEPVATSADDVAILAFTSGTTGRPKATAHFHRDLIATCDTFGRIVGAGPGDVFTHTPPLAFTYGLGGILLYPLDSGACSLLVEKAVPEELVDLITQYDVTVLFTSPPIYRAFTTLDDPGRIASLRRCVSAGEALPGPVWIAFEEATGIRIIDGIGSTEMLHIFIACADDDIRAGSTGKAVPGYVATVLDDDGNEVGDGELGRLAVKGPTGCRYLADERQSVYVQNGWNLTGDTYIRDADGYFWYQARSDDMIISSGYNIAGPEVEAALLAHPDVLECGVVGTADEARGMLVRAYVVLRDGVVGDEAKARELQDHTKATIAPYKYPRQVYFVDALPRTNTGKLQRFRLRDGGPE